MKKARMNLSPEVMLSLIHLLTFHICLDEKAPIPIYGVHPNN